MQAATTAAYLHEKWSLICVVSFVNLKFLLTQVARHARLANGSNYIVSLVHEDCLCHPARASWARSTTTHYSCVVSEGKVALKAEDIPTNTGHYNWLKGATEGCAAFLAKTILIFPHAANLSPALLHKVLIGLCTTSDWRWAETFTMLYFLIDFDFSWAIVISLLLVVNVLHILNIIF